MRVVLDESFVERIENPHGEQLKTLQETAQKEVKEHIEGLEDLEVEDLQESEIKKLTYTFYYDWKRDGKPPLRLPRTKPRKTPRRKTRGQRTNRRDSRKWRTIPHPRQRKQKLHQRLAPRKKQLVRKRILQNPRQQQPNKPRPTTQQTHRTIPQRRILQRLLPHRPSKIQSTHNQDQRHQGWECGGVLRRIPKGRDQRDQPKTHLLLRHSLLENTKKKNQSKTNKHHRRRNQPRRRNTGPRPPIQKPRHLHHPTSPLQRTQQLPTKHLHRPTRRRNQRIHGGKG